MKKRPKTLYLYNPYYKNSGKILYIKEINGGQSSVVAIDKIAKKIQL